MGRVALDLGVIQIYWYSICILVGMMAGMYVVYREAKKNDINETLITNLIFYTIIIAIIGARLYYVIFDWGYYSKNPIEILELWNGGLAIHGAIICGGLFLIAYTRKHKMDTIRVLDICSVGLIIGQALGRWGNFFNQEVFGKEVSLKFLQGLHLPSFIIDGMHIGGKYYQPLFLYESLWCILGFILLLIYRRRKYVKTGQIFGLYCMWYAVGRFVLEGMRDEKYNLMLGSLKVAQVVSIGMFVVGLFFFVRRFKTPRFEHLYNNSNIQTETTDNSQMTDSFFKKKKTPFLNNNNQVSGNVKSAFGQPNNQMNNQVSGNVVSAMGQQNNYFNNVPNMNMQPNNQQPVNTPPVMNVQPNNQQPVNTPPVMNVQQNNQMTNQAPSLMDNFQSSQPVINETMNNQTSNDPFGGINNNQNNSNNTFL